MPKVRIGVQATGASQLGRNYSGKASYGASRIAGGPTPHHPDLEGQTSVAGEMNQSRPTRTDRDKGLSSPRPRRASTL